jgi:hypothetical protein
MAGYTTDICPNLPYISPSGGGPASGSMIVGQKRRYSPKMTHDHGLRPFQISFRVYRRPDTSAIQLL